MCSSMVFSTAPCYFSFMLLLCFQTTSTSDLLSAYHLSEEWNVSFFSDLCASSITTKQFNVPLTDIIRQVLNATWIFESMSDVTGGKDDFGWCLPPFHKWTSLWNPKSFHGSQVRLRISVWTTSSYFAWGHVWLLMNGDLLRYVHHFIK